MTLLSQNLLVVFGVYGSSEITKETLVNIALVSVGIKESFRRVKNMATRME